MKTGIYFHEETCSTTHDIENINDANRARSLLEKELSSSYNTINLRKARLSDYESVHNKDYLETIEKLFNGENVKRPLWSIECVDNEYALPGYLYSLGGIIESIDMIKNGSLDRSYCYSIGGHHAYADHGHGYCILNPVAAAARYAQKKGFEKVLIVDWDIHHGDGTQSIFSNDKNVHCISIHSAVDLYMSLMRVTEFGTTTYGEKCGCQNIPILDKIFTKEFFKETGLDGIYYRAEDSIPQFEKAMERVPFSPDLVLIFSGYDSHKDDCGKNVTDWEDDDFRKLTRIVKKFDKPIISVNGGGYNMNSIISATIAHVEELFKN